MKFKVKKGFFQAPCLGFGPEGSTTDQERPSSSMLQFSRLNTLLSRGASNSGSAQRFEQVLQVLLLGDHATGDSKKACFAASKALAQVVSQYGHRTTLTLGNTSSLPSLWMGPKSKPSRAPADVAQDLASMSDNVNLVLNSTIVVPSACLYPCLTTLALHNMSLCTSDLAALHLHRLPHLHTVSLSNCKPNSAMGKTSLAKSSLAKSSSGMLSEPLPIANTITTIECVKSEPHSTQLIMMLLVVVDQSKVHTIITDDKGVADMLPRLATVRKLKMVPTSSPLGEHTLQQLLSHPGLKHAQLGNLDIKHNMANSLCHLEQLELVDTVVDAHTLAHLPLAGVPAVTVHTSLRVENSHSYSLNMDVNMEMALHNITACPGLVFQPTSGLRWNGDRTFSLDLLYSRNPVQGANLITAVMRRLPPGGVLEIQNGAVQAPEILSALQATPQQVHELVFSHMMHRLPQESGNGGIIAHVPVHVKHVRMVMHALDGAFYIEPWIEALFLFMREVRRPLKLSLVHCDYKAGRKPVLESPWPESMKQRVRNWLKACASDQVQVEFLCLV